MAFLAQEELSPETNTLKVSIIQEADPIKEKVSFCYYRLAKGISGILSHAKEGIRLWYRTKRPAYRQLCLKLTAWIDIVPCGIKEYVSPSPVPAAYKSASTLGAAILNLSKNGQIGTLERHTHLFITIHGNSSIKIPETWNVKGFRYLCSCILFFARFFARYAFFSFCFFHISTFFTYYICGFVWCFFRWHSSFPQRGHLVSYQNLPFLCLSSSLLKTMVL